MEDPIAYDLQLLFQENEQPPKDSPSEEELLAGSDVEDADFVEPEVSLMEVDDEEEAGSVLETVQSVAPSVASESVASVQSGAPSQELTVVMKMLTDMREAFAGQLAEVSSENKCISKDNKLLSDLLAKSMSGPLLTTAGLPANDPNNP